MNRTDQRLWASAQTLRELGALTARWLEGDITSQPGYAANCGPDPETAELIPVLATLNRAGYVTDVSQTGRGPEVDYDGSTWRQRAGVGGYADLELANYLTAVTAGAGLLVLRYEGASRWRAGHITIDVTQCEWQPTCVFGRRQSRRDLRSRYRECDGAVRDAVCAAVQLTIVDPKWGPNDLLWSTLRGAL